MSHAKSIHCPSELSVGVFGAPGAAYSLVALIPNAAHGLAIVPA